MEKTEDTDFYVQKIHPDSKIPTKGSKYAAGYDLYCYEDFTIEANK